VRNLFEVEIFKAPVSQGSDAKQRSVATLTWALMRNPFEIEDVYNVHAALSPPFGISQKNR
jgi:hypothetical protein